MSRSFTPAAPLPGRDVELLLAMRTRIDPRDARALNNLGVLYHTRGLYAEAVEAFERALVLDPRMRTAARNLEVAAAHPGACDRRLAELATRLATAPDDRLARLEQARLARMRGHHEAARQELDALLAEDPDDAPALFERGLMEHRRGHLRRAQRWLERAVNAGAGPEASLLLAEVLYQRGRNEQALAAVDAVLEAHAQLADAHRLRGFILGDMGHAAEALAAARQAATLDPQLESLDGDLVLPRSTGRPGEGGLADATDALSEEPDSALTHYHLGLAFRQRGYFPEARREFERAEAAPEAAPLVAQALAELDLIEGDVAAARRRYCALLARSDTARGWNEFGVACHLDGDVAAAADAYRCALQRDPRDGLAYNNLGVALADRGDPVAAREALARAVELDPAHALARLNLALAEARGGDESVALAHLRELVQFQPEEADAWFALGVVLARRQRLDEARAAFRQALEYRPGRTDSADALARRFAEAAPADSGAPHRPAAPSDRWPGAELPLRLGIALQRECPQAVGALELIPASGSASAAVLAATACDEADDWALQARHEQAAERYRQARALVADDPTHASLWRRAAVGEARTRCLQRQAHLARGLLEQLAAATPDDPEVCALQAAALLAGDAEHSRVRAAILRVLRREGASSALLHFTGDIALAIDDRELAMMCLRRALALDPTRPSPRVAIARLLRERGDLLAARLELTAALAAAPACRDAILELAHVETDAGRLAVARRVLVAYLARAPHDRRAMARLADILAREGRPADARIVQERQRQLATDPAAMRRIDDPRTEPRSRRARGAPAAAC